MFLGQVEILYLFLNSIAISPWITLHSNRQGEIAETLVPKTAHAWLSTLSREQHPRIQVFLLHTAAPVTLAFQRIPTLKCLRICHIQIDYAWLLVAGGFLTGNVRWVVSGSQIPWRTCLLQREGSERQLWWATLHTPQTADVGGGISERYITGARPFKQATPVSVTYIQNSLRPTVWLRNHWNDLS